MISGRYILIVMDECTTNRISIDVCIRNSKLKKSELPVNYFLSCFPFCVVEILAMMSHKRPRYL